MMSLLTSSSHEQQSRAMQQYITSVTDNDVILGRGLAFVKHPGNIFFRRVIQQKRNEYASSCRRRIKRNISNDVWSIFCTQNCRFVMEVKQEGILSPSDGTDVSEKSSKLYVIADKRKVLQKIKQALRESDSKCGATSLRAPKIKNNFNETTAPTVPLDTLESSRNRNKMAESNSDSVCPVPGSSSYPFQSTDQSSSLSNLNVGDPNSSIVRQLLFNIMEQYGLSSQSLHNPVSRYSHSRLLNLPKSKPNNTAILHPQNTSRVQVGTVSLVMNNPIWTVTVPDSNQLIAGISNRVSEANRNEARVQLSQNQFMNSQNLPTQTQIGLNSRFVPQLPSPSDIQSLLSCISGRSNGQNITTLQDVIDRQSQQDRSILNASDTQDDLVRFVIQHYRNQLL